MKSPDLDHLLRELPHAPRSEPELGEAFTEGVLHRLKSKRVVLPLAFLAIITGAILLLSVTIGGSIGKGHEHAPEEAAPPALIGIEASELPPPSR